MQAPKWYWWVAGIGLLWNLIGAAAFASQMTMDLSTLPQAQQDFYATTPVWATAAFAIAVGCGVLGCIALLLRKTWAVPLLGASLAGIVVQTSHSMLLSNGMEVFGPAGLTLPILTLLIAIGLLLFSRNATKQGWIASS